MSNPVAGTSEPDAGVDASTVSEAAAGDSLSSTAETSVAACGNGRLDPGESCDDGNRTGLDGCSAACTLEPGSVCPEPGAPCDITPYCGDGRVESSEQCDDGINNGSYGHCSSSCTVGSYCGDGIVQAEYEQCDLGINDGRYGGCNSDCTVGPYCGDGIVQAEYEQCDDGNTVNGDGCSDTCQVEPCWAACGCNSNVPCTQVAICGNGKLEGAESCDDGNTQSGDGCSGTCQIEAGWSCVAPGMHCTSVCGDGIVASNEQCDDGNSRSGDGCSSTCQSERGY